MNKLVSPSVRLSATAIEELKTEIAADVASQIKETFGKFLAEQALAMNDRSVSGFCKRWGISRFLFYDKIAEMPAVLHVGGRTLISPEAEALWIKQREAAAQVAPKRIVGRARNAGTAPQLDDHPPLK
jgi:hypothetical protein